LPIERIGYASPTKNCSIEIWTRLHACKTATNGKWLLATHITNAYLMCRGGEGAKRRGSW